MPIKSILIASDLSERSDRAIKRGLMLARSLGAEATLGCIVDDDMPEDMVSERVERSEAHLEASMKELGGGLSCQVAVRVGEPVSRLVSLVNGKHHDLVVVGRHRTREMFDGLRRTTVESVVSQSLKPVLLVAGPVHGPYERVLAPVAFSMACRSAVALAREVAPGAGERVFHAWMAPFEGLSRGGDDGLKKAVEREIREQARTWAAGLDPAPEVKLRHGGVTPRLEAELRAFVPDLLAVGANTRALSFTGVGAFTSELIRHPPTDLLISRATTP
ncbi:universal stress protein [Vannielia litorea]|uniref:Nucleotide-binding universal stress protein, UspA family n=1 Tax=Vannielia litorea TaxID=1217970 RepID=A0A1N6E270_9RHOB|nr:universal stress protein [Vannielia litorea]SIN77091.1 Nucleotide-binding universal stress protein, UspA family [Vannielia litorea]